MSRKACPDCGATMLADATRDGRASYTRCPWADLPPAAERTDGAAYRCDKPRGDAGFTCEYKPAAAR